MSIAKMVGYRVAMVGGLCIGLAFGLEFLWILYDIATISATTWLLEMAPVSRLFQRARLEMRPPMHHRCIGLVGLNRPHWALLARGRPAEGRPSSLAPPAAIAI